MSEEKIGEAVRDITSVAVCMASKSAVRRIVEQLIEDTRRETAEEVLGVGESLKRKHYDDKAFLEHRNTFNDAYNEVVKDYQQIITTKYLTPPTQDTHNWKCKKCEMVGTAGTHCTCDTPDLTFDKKEVYVRVERRV